MLTDNERTEIAQWVAVKTEQAIRDRVRTAKGETMAYPSRVDPNDIQAVTAIVRRMI